MIDFSTLNNNQRQAVEFTDGPCLVIAAAGTGKTHTLISRVVNLVDNGVNEENILLLTFTNKAANEMKSRACKMLKKDDLKITACTYHSFCIMYLRKYAALLGLNNNFSVIDSPDVVDIMKIIIDDKGFTELSQFPSPAELATIFSNNVNKQIEIKEILEIEYPSYIKYLDKIVSLQNDYREYKLDRNIVDYDDILVYFIALLKSNPHICKNISDVFHYIMVDEYQDSNGLQFEILSLLRQYENKNIMVVGDDQQCFPAGTKISTVKGLKNIEDVSLNDSLFVASGRGTTSIAKPESISKKLYKGNLFKIKTKTGRELSATPNHVIFADYTLENKHFVYLAYSPTNGFSIGKDFSKGQEFNYEFNSKMSREDVERIWLLKVCENEQDCTFFEKYYIFKYGIPFIGFKDNSALDKESVDALFKTIDAFEKGEKVLNDLELFFDYPHIINNLDIDNKMYFNNLEFLMFGEDDLCISKDFNGYKHKLSYSRDKEDVYAGNGFKVFDNQDKLLDFANNIMPNFNYFKKQAVLIKDKVYDFVPFSNLREGMHVCINLDGELIEDEVISVEKVFYEDYVYDINVPQYRNYIANEIVVHNCIYGFRGSKFDNIMHFPDEFEGTTVIVLDENYRSNQEILDVANVVIDKAKEKYPKILKANHSCDRKPILLEAYNSEEEANYVLDEIEKLMCPPYNYSMNDIAVLIRTSRDSYILESLLTKKDYTYQKFGGIKFLERDFVKNIFAFLKLSINESDELSWFRVLQLYPNMGIVYAKKTTAKILENGLDELLDPEYTKKRFSKSFPEIHSVIEHLKGLDLDAKLDYLINKYYFELVDKTVLASNKSNNKKDIELKKHKDEKSEAPVLRELANGYTSTLSFLTDLTLELPERDKDLEKLTISTIHSAKGLEFKAVFVINCIDGNYPSNSRIAPLSEKAIKRIDEEYEENRRVFYVAITRAKDYLYLTYPKTKFLYDRSIEKTKLSPFIDKDVMKTVDFNIKERDWFNKSW